MKPEGVALVTGASRGIGHALARELAERGFEVVATAREPASLTALVQGARDDGLRLRAAKMDVTRPETIELPAGLRVLVNNAGVDTEYLPVEHAPDGLWRAAFETNLFGALEVTRRAIPKLREAGGGVLCNVTSVSLLAPMPLYAGYRASKAALSALGESLRAELAPFGIRVLEILPGPIGTDMLAASDRMPEASAWPEYQALAERAWQGRSQAAESATSPRDAARAIADAILDDDAPLRVGCDPLAKGLLEAWRGQSDEEMMRGMLAAFRTEPQAKQEDEPHTKDQA